MGKYIHLFETNNEFVSAYSGENYLEPWVSYTEQTDDVNYNKERHMDANGFSYVDLGLPSETLWAEMNVGATASTDPGDYFAWGEISSKSYLDKRAGTNTGTTLSSGKQFSYQNYKFVGWTKYNSTDNKTVLEPVDDGAFINMGGDWKLPVRADLDELLENTTSAWTTTGGNNYLVLTSNINGNTLTFPAAGIYNTNYGSGALFGFNDGLGIWSSTLHADNDKDQSYDINAQSGATIATELIRPAGINLRGVLPGTAREQSTMVRYEDYSSIGTVAGDNNDWVTETRKYIILYDESTGKVALCGMQVVGNDGVARMAVDGFDTTVTGNTLEEGDWIGFSTSQGSAWGAWTFTPMRMTPGATGSTTFTSGSSSITMEYQIMTNTYNNHQYYCLKKETINGSVFVEYIGLYNVFSDSIANLQSRTQSADGGAEMFHLANKKPVML